jgi:transcriptional antiterminator RfaH
MESYWACARLAQHRESLGLASLQRNGFPTYYPRIREHRRTSTGRKIEVKVPLFAGYCFFVIQLQWHAAQKAPGVLSLIMDGVSPGKVPSRVIADLKAREDGGCVVLPAAPAFAPGDPIRVADGLFKGSLGVFSGMKSQQRVEVLLTFLGTQRATVLPASSIEAI